MAQNRGKDFEDVFRDCVEKVSDTSIVRLHDQVQGYLGARNHCDFIVYHYPFEYHIECKSVHGNRLPFTNITDFQWRGLSKVSKVKGVVSGVVCWYIDRDVTLFIPIKTLEALRYNGAKSISYEIMGDYEYLTYEIPGKKKRVFFDYDIDSFFHAIEKSSRSN